MGTGRPGRPGSPFTDVRQAFAGLIARDVSSGAVCRMIGINRRTEKVRTAEVARVPS